MNGNTFLVTGGTGSFGQAFVKYVLRHFSPRKVIIFSRDEWKQNVMRSRLHDDRLRFFLGDIRDKDRLITACRDVDVVVHAAALKQVPAGEYNPTEFKRTNVDGAVNVVEAAYANPTVGRVLALSTDKACNPVNLYGATKLMSEKVILGGNVYRGARDRPLLSCVRYGNVAGSRGSVIPLFLQQHEDGMPFTVTDPGMTRFFMTLEESVFLVVRALTYMQGGEVFVPEIPSFRIPDLCKAIDANHPVVVTGIRPGEKLHETLISAQESHLARKRDDLYVVGSYGFDAHTELVAPNLEGERLPAGFAYTSDTNERFLTVEELREYVRGIPT